MSGIFGKTGVLTKDEIDSMSFSLSHRGGNIQAESNNQYSFYGLGAGAIVERYEDIIIAFSGSIYSISDNKFSDIDSFEHIQSEAINYFINICEKKEYQKLENINGDYAFSIYNKRKKTIVLVRDYFGCLPLYYCHDENNDIVFASEYKVFAYIKNFSPYPDFEMVQHLQHAKKLPPGKTLFKNIHAVKPGVVTEYNLISRNVTFFERPPIKVSIKVNDEEYAIDLIKKGLKKSIYDRSRDQKNIGLALSGGIDSIALAYILRNLYPDKDIHTFTAGHSEEDHEIVTARKVAAAIGSIHHEIFTPPTILQGTLQNLVWHIEDPCSRSEVLQLYMIGEKAQRYVSVLFSGQAADSLFAGMPKYKLIWLTKILPMFRTSFEEFYNLTQLGLAPKTIVAKLLAHLKFKNTLALPPRIKGTTYVPKALSLPKTYKENINQYMASTFQSGTCQDIHKFERTFSAFGVSYRSPFHDQEFVKLAFSISDKLKIKKGKEKYIFRKALESIVPAEFTNIPKFPQRMKYNIEFSNELEILAEENCSLEKISKYKLFSYKEIVELRRLSKKYPSKPETVMRLWTAVLTQIWADLFLTKPAN